jgi:UPF0755 protein
MTRPPDPRWDQDERRNARIRELREQREAPIRRRRSLQPVVLIGWFAGVIALVGALIFLGFLAFAPTLMTWVEEHPGSIEHGIVQDFVDWYSPGVLADEPVDGEGERITITVESGASDAEIGLLLVEEGVVRSQLAFQWAVLQAGREGTLQAGTYDLSPAMKPSEIVAALRQETGEEIEVTIQEGWRLEEIVGYLGSTRLTMDLDEFARLVQSPPADLLNQYDYLADLPAGRTLEGYLYPDSYRLFVNEPAREIVERLLENFGNRLTQEIRDGIAARGLSIDDAVNVASIVEREAVLNDERPQIAGVYLNRVTHPEAETVGLMNADPTLQYGLATQANANAPVDDWGSIEWWPPLEVGGAEVELPEELAGYQTYVNKGLPPTPIASPRMGSVAAVANADTASGFYYFVAGCPNGERDGSHYFGRTLGEHEANIATANAECPAG